MKQFHYDTIDSTNSQATRLVQRGEIAPFMVTAATQSAGRGRNGRSWQSPTGGAWMSAVWPIHHDPAHYTAFPLVVGLAAWHAIHDVARRAGHFDPARLRIKWPNDILLDDHKVCGILCETVASSLPGSPVRVSHLIAGVGINVSFPATTLTGELRHPPTTLLDHFPAGSAWVDSIIRAFSREFNTHIRQFDRHGFDAATQNAIQSRLAYIGRVRTWQFGEQRCSGTIEGIDAQGRLLIDIDGQISAFDSGELCAIDPVLTSF